jgi:hypothetical protein
MRNLMLALGVAGASIPFSALAADNDLSGTYKLVIEQRKIVDTGELVPIPNRLHNLWQGWPHARAHCQKTETTAGKRW